MSGLTDAEFDEQKRLVELWLAHGRGLIGEGYPPRKLVVAMQTAAVRLGCELFGVDEIARQLSVVVDALSTPKNRTRQ